MGIDASVTSVLAVAVDETGAENLGLSLMKKRMYSILPFFVFAAVALVLAHAVSATA